jgi:hypothetical protein
MNLLVASEELSQKPNTKSKHHFTFIPSVGVLLGDTGD